MMCVQSCRYGMTFCDSILSPPVLNRVAATGGSSSVSCCWSTYSKSSSFNRNGVPFGLPLREALEISRRKKRPGLCFVLSESSQQETETVKEKRAENGEGSSLQSLEFLESLRKTVENNGGRLSERAARRKTERYAYLFAAIASSLGITSMAAAAVYSRFVWQMQGEEVPYTEMFGTFLFAAGAAVGMEFWARWAHRALWHASLWHMHESHHRPREGPFELNDVFAIINAIPAISLLSYGFFNKGLAPGLCFGAGLGITCFGMAYMFVHDGLVHRRFPVGPIADVPYFQKVATAHQLHHADKFNGVPYGLFLGPKELEEVGGLEELETLLSSKRNTSKGNREGK